MNEVKIGVATDRRVGKVCACTFVPRESRAYSLPLSFIQIEGVIALIDINVLLQVAVGSTNHQVVYKSILQELLLGDVPAETERMRERLTIALSQAG